MNEFPLVSICIPNFNYGRYLPQCFESVLNQTYKNIEVYFRDNNSTDNSYSIALKYRELFREKGIFFSVNENKENIGSDKNSKLCERDSEGEFIYTLASDDAIDPTFIERCINVFLNNPEVGTVITHRVEIDENNNMKNLLPFYNTDCIIDGESQAAVYMMAGIAIPGQRIVRSSVLKQGKKYRRSFQVAGDWFDNFLYSCFGDVAYITEPLCYYRVHSGNETNESEMKLMGIFEHYQLLNAFNSISKSLGMEKPTLRYEEAVKKLGDMCLRYANKMIILKEKDIAIKYINLALVFKPEIKNNEIWIKIDKYLKSSSEEVKYLDYEKVFLERAISYDPPEGYIKINKNGEKIIK
jgi:glycosyltransferase involved in cell wall biosynthesis